MPLAKQEGVSYHIFSIDVFGAKVDALHRLFLDKVWFVHEDEDAAPAVVPIHKFKHGTLVELWQGVDFPASVVDALELFKKGIHLNLGERTGIRGLAEDRVVGNGEEILHPNEDHLARGLSRKSALSVAGLDGLED